MRRSSFCFLDSWIAPLALWFTLLAFFDWKFLAAPNYLYPTHRLYEYALIFTMILFLPFPSPGLRVLHEHLYKILDRSRVRL